MDAAFTDDEILEDTPTWDTAPEHTDNLRPIQWNSFGPVEKLLRVDDLGVIVPGFGFCYALELVEGLA